MLSYLENVDVNDYSEEIGFYLPVQRVCRPDYSFREFQGQIETKSAFKGQAVTVQLDREVDVSRGSVIEKDSGLEISSSITAALIWMDDKPLNNGGSFFIKTGTNLIPGLVAKILHKIDINTGELCDSDVLIKNEIAICKISFTDKITIDKFNRHKTTGELILIDRVTFMTSACGVVEDYTRSGIITENRISPKRPKRN